MLIHRKYLHWKFAWNPIIMLFNFATLYSVSLGLGWVSGMISPSGSRFEMMTINSSLIRPSSSNPHSDFTLSTQLLKSWSSLRNSVNVNRFLVPQWAIKVLLITLFEDFPSDSEAAPSDDCKMLGGTTKGFEYTVFFSKATSIQWRGSTLGSSSGNTVIIVSCIWLRNSDTLPKIETSCPSLGMKRPSSLSFCFLHWQHRRTPVVSSTTE